MNPNHFLCERKSATEEHVMIEKNSCLYFKFSSAGSHLITLTLYVIFFCLLAVEASAQGTPITPTAGFTNANRFSFTGTDQTFTVPSGVSSISVKIWGAGAGGSNATVTLNGATRPYYSNGGSGGYVSGTIPVSQGDVFTIMVGEGGRSDGNAGWATRSYGFGGLAVASNYGSDGGGLSGIFINTGTITATSSPRAVLIAGGGGGGELGPSALSVGGQGGDAVYSGGQSTMLGADNTTAAGGGGGGGGYGGGSSNQLRLSYSTSPARATMGEGGSSFIAPNVTNSSSLASSDYVSPYVTNDPGLPPSSTDAQYIGGTGVGTNVTTAQGGNGLVVIQYNLATLPLTLLSFTAEPQNNKYTLLKWATSSEHNSSFFRLMRSEDGNQFTDIGTVSAAGNSSTELNYSFIDYQPATGPAYYRIKMVDVDGKAIYSAVQLANSSAIGLGLTAYPNPARNSLTVTGVKAGMELRVLATDGRLLITQKATAGSAVIPVQHLTKGMYFVQSVKEGVVLQSVPFTK